MVRAIAGSSPAHAEVELVSGPAPGVISEEISGPSGRVLITLRNTNPTGKLLEDESLRIRPLPEFRSAASDALTPAEWSRLDGRAPQDGQFLLAPGEAATFEVRGVFPSAGLWETALDAFAPDGALAQRFVVQATTSRPAPSPGVPADFLQIPLPARIQLGPFEPSTASERYVTLIGRNAGPEEIRLADAGVGRVFEIDGGAQVAIAPTAAVAAERCASAAPRIACTMTLVLPPGFGPGTYIAEVIVNGLDGGQSVREQRIEVRGSAWWAGGLAGLGALLGALVTGWRETGRPRVEARILLAERRSHLGRLLRATTWPPARLAGHALMERLRELDGRIRRGAGAPDLAPYDGHLQAIALAVEAQAEAGRMPSGFAHLLDNGTRALAAALAAVAGDASLDPAKGKAVADAAVALQNEAVEVGALIEASREAAAAMASHHPTLRRLIDLWRQRSDWQTLEDLLDQARDPLTPPETIAARAQKITQAAGLVRDSSARGDAPTALLNGVQQQFSDAATEEARARLLGIEQEAKNLQTLWASLPPDLRLGRANALAAELAKSGEEAAVGPETSVEIPALLPAGSALSLDLGDVLSGPAGVASLGSLESYRGRWNILANVVVLVGISAAAIPLLWAGDPVWGAPEDLMVALLAGLGTRFAIESVTPVQ